MRATYFDGRTAHAQSVTLEIDFGSLLVSGEGISRQDPIGAVSVSDVLGSTLRVLQFVDGASCEVADNDAFATMLAGHGVAPSRVSAWERSWRPAAAANAENGTALTSVMHPAMYLASRTCANGRKTPSVKTVAARFES